MPIEISEEAGVRYLHFGSRWIQGAMRVQRPYALELDYTRAMMVTLLLGRGHQGPRRILLIGLGAGSLVKFLYRHRPRAHLTVVEIEPRVVAVARQFFRLPEDSERLAIEIGNGEAWLAASRSTFDLVLVDGFDARGRPGALDSVAFYRHCRDCLSPHGLFATNLLSRSRGVDASVARLRLAFEERVLVLPSTEAGNTIAIAATGEPVELALRDLATRAGRLREETGLNLHGVVAGIASDHGGRGGTLRL